MNIPVASAVVGIHIVALGLLLTNPGCSSTNKPAPSAAETAAKSDPSPAVSVPLSSGSSGSGSSDHSPLAPAPVTGDSSPVVTFNSPSSAGNAVRYSPTRPGTSAASVLEAQPVADVTPVRTYTVVSGDNLTSVAKKNKLTITELAKANNLKSSSTLHQGQKLIIPSKAITPPATSADASVSHENSPAAATVAKSATDVVKHTVKPGETLGAIAKKYGVKTGDIAVANNITDPAKIRPGKELIIPSPQTSATKSGSKSSKPASSAAAASHDTTSNSTTSVRSVPENKSAPAAPPPGQDLDAGLQPGTTSDVPVIKVQDAPTPSPKNF